MYEAFSHCARGMGGGTKTIRVYIVWHGSHYIRVYMDTACHPTCISLFHSLDRLLSSLFC